MAPVSGPPLSSVPDSEPHADYRLFGAFGTEDLVSGEGFGPRLVAKVIDAAAFITLQIAAGIVFLIPLGIVAGARGLPPDAIAAAAGQVTPVGYLASILANFAYFVVFEWLWGSTPGKRAMGLVVVSEELRRCTLEAAIKRNVLYFLEGLAWGIPAFFAMRNSPRAQRHGDRWAGTIVPRRALVPPGSIGSARGFLLASLGVSIAMTAATAARLPGQVEVLRAAMMQAEPGLASLSEADPDAPPGDLYAAGLAAFQRKDYRAAIESWLTHLAANADDERAWYGLGRAYSETSDWQNAANVFGQLVKRAPRHPDAWAAAGIALERMDRPTDAMTCYRNQIVAVPSHAAAHKRLGLLLFDRGEWKAAEASLRIASSAASAEPDVDVALGRARLKLRDTPGALEAFDRVRTRQDTSSGQLNQLAQLLADEGVALDRADQWAGEAIASAARESTALDIDTLTMDDTQLSWRISWMWYGRARVALKAGDLPKAERYLRAAHAFRAVAPIVRDLGVVVQRAGHKDQAAQLFAEALTLSDDAETRSLLRAAGLPDSAVPAAVDEARRRRLDRQAIRLGKGMIPGGSATVLLLFTNGRPGVEVRAVPPDPRLDALLARAETAAYAVPFPDDTPAKVACWGSLRQDPLTGECVLAIAMGMRPPPEK